MAEVRLKGVGKRFGAVEVLSGIDLTIHDGEFFTLLGPSGCGKSTLLHLIAGLEGLGTGEIAFDGEEVSQVSPRDRDVAVVFQSYALYPHMTVRENLAFPLRMKRWPAKEIDRQVGWAAQMLGLTPLLPKRPRALSGGQRQRVALGRAMVRKPRLFLLDEPLSNLDAQLRTEMRGELKRLHQTLRATMIYVTHDQMEAMTLSDRMAVLQGGRIQQCGTPQEVYARPANRFVASFIGSPPMNLLPAQWSDGSPPALMLGGEDRMVLPDVKAAVLRSIASEGRLLVGIRPEDLLLYSEGGADRMAMEVQLIEPMGAEVWVVLAFGGQHLRGRVSGPFAHGLGETLYVAFDKAKLHFFDEAGGKRIDLPE